MRRRKPNLETLFTIVVGLILGILVFLALIAIEPIVTDTVVEKTMTVRIVEVTPEPHTVHYGIDLPDEFQAYVIDLCQQYQVPASIVFAIIQIESDCDISKVGDNGNSYGLMQINAQYHQERMERLGVIDLLDAADNVLVGVDYLAELYSYGKSDTWTLMAYNGGIVYADGRESHGNISSYAEQVLELAEQLEEGVS